MNLTRSEKYFLFVLSLNVFKYSAKTSSQVFSLFILLPKGFLPLFKFTNPDKTGFSIYFFGLENNLFAKVDLKRLLKTSSATDWISFEGPSSGLRPNWEKNMSYLVDSKSPAFFGGYLRGLPRPRFGRPINNSGCFVFLWLFSAGWLRKDLPQSHANILPFNSCLDRRRLSINNNKLY